MSTDRQKSFIATLGTDSSLLHFLDLLHGQPAIVTSSFASGGFFTGRRQTRDDSHYLGLRPEVPVDAKPRLTLYFRYTENYYRLYIRTPGPHYGKCLSISDHGLLGAFTATDSTTFNLLDGRGGVLTLDTIKTDSLSIYLRVKNSGVVHRHTVHDSKYIYMADRGETPLSFNVIIQERNAAYVSHPNEI